MFLFFFRNGAGAQLDHGVAAVGLGLQQGPIGAAEHGFGRVAGLNFGDAEAGGDRTAFHLGLGGLGERLADVFGASRGRGVVTVGREKDELLAAVSGDQVAGPAGVLQQRCQGLDRFVARLVAVVVVHLLEPVQVADHQAARDLLLLVVLDEGVVHAVELGPVGHLGKRVFGRFFVQGLAALFQRSLRRGVVQDHDRAERRSVVGHDGDGVAVNGNQLLVAAADSKPSERLHSGENCTGDGTILGGQGVALFVMDLQERRLPLPFEHGRLGHAGQTLRPVIPLLDAQGGVDENHGVVHVVQKPGLEEVALAAGGGVFGWRFAKAPRGVGRIGVQLAEPAGGRVAAEFRRLGGAQLDELLDQRRVELAACVLEQLSHGPFPAHRRPVDVVGGHRVEGFDDRDHSGAVGDLFTHHFVAGFQAVVPGADVLDDFQHRRVRASAAEDLQAPGPSALDGLHLLTVQRAGLQEHAVGNADRACVVQQSGQLDGVSARVGQTH